MSRAAASAVALALALALALAACGRDAEPSRESRDRDAFVADLARREGLVDVWHLTSRTDLSFEEGASRLSFADDRSFGRPWTAPKLDPVTDRGRPVRWMGPRVLLKVRGSEDARLEITGRVDLHKLFTRPRVTVTFGGRELWSQLVDVDGTFHVGVDVPAAWLRGWTDVYVTLSSVSEPWRDPVILQVARLERVVWQPRLGGR